MCDLSIYLLSAINRSRKNSLLQNRGGFSLRRPPVQEALHHLAQSKFKPQEGKVQPATRDTDVIEVTPTLSKVNPRNDFLKELRRADDIGMTSSLPMVLPRVPYLKSLLPQGVILYPSVRSHLYQKESFAAWSSVARSESGMTSMSPLMSPYRHVPGVMLLNWPLIRIKRSSQVQDDAIQFHPTREDRSFTSEPVSDVTGNFHVEDITGGYEAQRGAYPWIALLGKKLESGKYSLRSWLW